MREAVVDTHVLLRYLTDEPRDLADRASAIFEKAEARRTQLVVVPIVVAEVVYVLETVYKWNRASIAGHLLDLLSAASLDFLELDAVFQSLVWYRDVSSLDFADAFVAAVSVDRHHGVVVSFDRDLKRLSGLTVIQQPSDLE